MAEFALNTRDRFKNSNWARQGLPANVAIRIGMELGSVNLVPDDEGEIDVSGATIEMAARIEPITPPNTVWISDHYANQLQREAAPNLAMQSLGEKALHKNSGVANIFELLWKTEGASPEASAASENFQKPIGHIPRVRREFSDIERDRFLLQAFKTIQDYFERSLQTLKEAQPNLVEVSLDTVTNHKFVAKVLVNGEERSSCKVWLGDEKLFGGRTRSIGYSKSFYDINNDNSYNEKIEVSDDGYELHLEVLGMLIWDDDKQFSPESAADHL